MSTAELPKPPLNYAFPTFIPGRFRIPPDFKLWPEAFYPDLQAANLPQTPPIPPQVLTGDVISSGHENTVSNAINDLWINEQWLAAHSVIDPTTAAGDLLVRGASGIVALPVGTQGQMLTVDTTQPDNMKWATITPSTIGGVPSSRKVIAGTGLSGGGALTADVTLTANVVTVFGRTGAVVAASGDYTAAQVTNAVSTIGNYADPAWITSLSWGKISGAPTVSGTANYVPVFTAANALVNSIMFQSSLRLFVAGNSEKYGFGVQYSLSGGPIYFGATSNVATPDGAISNGGGMEIIRFAANGNVGISTMTPNRLLEVGAGIPGSVDATNIKLAVLSKLAAADASGKALILNMSGSPFSGAGELNAYDWAGSLFIPLHINGSQILMGDASRGNAQVGIGPAGISGTSATRLTVSSSGPQVIFLQGVYGSAISNNTQVTFHGSAAATDLWVLGTDILAGNGSQDFVFVNNAGTTSGVTMTLQRGGNVGIGTTSPTSPLTVFGANPQLLIGDGSGENFSIGRDIGTGVLQFKGNQASYSAYAFFVNTSTQVLTITNSGNLGIGLSPSYQLQLSTDSAAKPATTTWTVPSDIRLKRNIRDLTGGLAVIEKLHLIEAEYNGLGNMPEGLRVVGFLAHELREIVPHAVGSTRGKLKPDDAGETDILDMNIHEVLMHLILAVQQLNQRREKN